MAKASAKALAERPGLGGDSDSAQDRAVVLQPGEKWKGVPYPFCFDYGRTRGTPLDRYYLNRFVEEIRPDVVGDTLEIGGIKHNQRLYNFMRTTSYRGMDLKKHPDVDIVGDAHNAKIVEHDSLDSIIIFNVLEHCEKPWVVVANMYDWLRKGGKYFAWFQMRNEFMELRMISGAFCRMQSTRFLLNFPFVGCFYMGTRSLQSHH